MNVIRVVNRTRGTLLGNRIALVDTWSGRLRGYLGRPEPKPGEGMLLVGCSAVHMFGMVFPLDLVFLDRNGEVVDAIERLMPWKRTKRVQDARFALELPIGVIDASQTAVGDRLVWATPEPVFRRPTQLDQESNVEPSLWSHQARRDRG